MRFTADGTTNRSIGVGMRSTAVGTLLQSPGISAAVTTWYSNRDDGYLNVPLASSRTPDGLPWTVGALNDLRVAIADADSNARPLMDWSLSLLALALAFRKTRRPV